MGAEIGLCSRRKKKSSSPENQLLQPQFLPRSELTDHITSTKHLICFDEHSLHLAFNSYRLLIAVVAERHCF